MKTAAQYVAISIAALLVIFCIMYAVRLFNSASVQVKTVRPEPGIVCVIASTTDGAAVSCLRDGL